MPPPPSAPLFIEADSHVASPRVRRLRVLSISTMFPSDALPVHAVFVRNRLREVAPYVDLRVISPVPAFPLAARLVGRYRARLDIPGEQVHPAPGAKPDPARRLFVRYPHFLSVPGVLKPGDGVTLAATIRREVARYRAIEGFAPDLLDAHLAFPDGYAAVLAARSLKLPVTITLRGHDINDLPRFPVRWRQVKYALRHATAVFGVCRALIDAAVEAGADPETSMPITNGVDATRFRPISDAAASLRAELGISPAARVVLSVGHMVARKGFHVLVDALAHMDRAGRSDVHMVFIGAAGEEGDYTREVRERVDAAGLTARVHFEGAVPNDELPRYYSAADVFALASEKEGWPNVLFEALACGTPPVATRVWGTPECISRPAFGTLVDDRAGAAFARALTDALDRDWDTQLLVRYARANRWADVGRRMAVELYRAYGRHRGRSMADLEAEYGPCPRGPRPPLTEAVS